MTTSTNSRRVIPPSNNNTISTAIFTNSAIRHKQSVNRHQSTSSSTRPEFSRKKFFQTFPKHVLISCGPSSSSIPSLLSISPQPTSTFLYRHNAKYPHWPYMYPPGFGDNIQNHPRLDNNSQRPQPTSQVTSLPLQQPSKPFSTIVNYSDIISSNNNLVSSNNIEEDNDIIFNNNSLLSSNDINHDSDIICNNNHLLANFSPIDSNDAYDSFLNNKQPNNSSKNFIPYNCININIQETTASVFAIIDSGAVRSCIDKQFVHNSNLQILPLDENDSHSFIAANKQTMPVHGKVEISFFIQDTPFVHQLFIIENFSAKLLFGLDFMEKYSATFDAGRRIFSLLNNTIHVPLVNPSHSSPLVTCKTNVILTPHSQQLVPLYYLNYVQPKHDLLLMEPLHPTSTASFLIPKMLVSNSNRAHVCPVLNDTDTDIFIPKGTPLAILSPVHPEDVVEDPTTINLISHTYEELEIKLTNDALSETEKRDFKNLINQYGDVFALSNEELEGTTLGEYSINIIPGSKPVRQAPYNQSAKAREAAETEIKELLRIGFIRPSVSPWAANIVMVKKKDTSQLRMAIDYRGLNKCIVPEIHHVPSFLTISDTLAFQAPTIFSSLDLRSGFHNLVIEEQSRKYTSFHSSGAQYEYTRAPFGIATIPAHMVRAVTLMLTQGDTNALLRWALAYLDDILVFSKSVAEHIKHLEDIFKRLRAARMKLHPKKCVFLQPKLKFLGNIISAQGIGPDPDKVSAMLNYPRPKSQKDLKALLGMLQFYKRFTPHYSQLVAPLNRLLAHDVKFIWGPTEDKAFHALRDGLKNAPFLAYPTETDTFCLTTDASSVATGFVLTQITPSGEEKIIAMGGRQLSPAEKNYSITEQETLSILQGVELYRHYLVGRKFIIRSDHISLKWINSLKDGGTGRLHRWSILLSQYDFDLEFIKGVDNGVANALSRRPYPTINDTFSEELANETTLFTLDTDNQNSPNFVKNIAKHMSYLLRHGAINEGVEISDTGFISLENLIIYLHNKGGNSITDDFIKYIVFNDLKQRFAIEYFNNQAYIRAVNGHSIPVPALSLSPLDPKLFIPIIHVTQLRHVPNILATGLFKGARNHIHFTTSESQHNLGAKFLEPVYVFIDNIAAADANIHFFKTDNNVIVTPGDDNGFIPSEYIIKILDKSSNTLYQNRNYFGNCFENSSAIQTIKPLILTQPPSLPSYFHVMENQTNYPVIIPASNPDATECQKLLNTLTTLPAEISGPDILHLTEISLDAQIDLQKLQMECPEIGPIYDFFKNNKTPKNDTIKKLLAHTKDKYFIQDDILWHRSNAPGQVTTLQSTLYQKVVPVTLRHNLIKDYHIQLAHQGTERTLLAISRHYWWYRMQTEVHNFIKRCLECQRAKSYSFTRALLKPLRPENHHSVRLFIDHVGPLATSKLGNKYVFTVIDSFSGWPYLFPVTSTNADEAVQCLLQVVANQGSFKTLISDNGSSLCGQIMKGFCELWGIQKKEILAHSPQANGKLEKMHRHLAEALRTLGAQNEDWDTKLVYIAMAFRSTPIGGVGISPFSIQNGGASMLLPCDQVILEKRDEHKIPDLPYISNLRRDIDLIANTVHQNILVNQEKHKHYYDLKTRPVTFSVGNLVWLFDDAIKIGETRKLHNFYRGPFIITEVINDIAVRLQNPENNKIILKPVKINRLKLCYLPQQLSDLNKHLTDSDIEMAENSNPEIFVDPDTPLLLDQNPTDPNPVNTPLPTTPQPVPHSPPPGHTVPNDTETDQILGDFYSAERILQQRIVRGQKQFLVKWLDPDASPTWCLDTDVTPDLISYWYDTHTLDGKSRKRKRKPPNNDDTDSNITVHNSDTPPLLYLFSEDF